MSINVTLSTGISSTQLVLGPEHTVSSLIPRVYAMTGYEKKTIRFKVAGREVSDPQTTVGELATGADLVLEISGRSEFGDLDDVSSIQKFEISDEVYGAMGGTVRDIKKKAGVPVKGEIVKQEDVRPEGIEVGNRCEVELSDHSHHRGAVRFVGKCEGASGYWIGVELDEPFGKNDGATKGKRYFQCDENHGVFLRASKVNAGDFPQIDWDKELEDEM